MRRVNRGQMIFFISLVTLLFVVSSFTFAQEEKKDQRPERGIAVYPEFSGITITRGDTVRMDLTLENKGRTDETIDVKISTVPKGWKASLRGGSFAVSGLFVPNGKSRTLALSLEPNESMGLGTYDLQTERKTTAENLTS